MSDGLRSYLEYKDSGVDWLGDLPAHWEVKRIKTVVQELNTRSESGSELLLSLTRARGLVPQSEMNNRGQTARTLIGYKICKPNDIVMNRMQAWSGMFAKANIEGLVSPDYAIFEPAKDANSSYLVSLFKIPVLVDQFAIASKGIGTGFNRLYTNQFGAIEIPLPPPDEQDTIVRFLDAAEYRIRRYIRAKQKLIKLLNEQKQAIIQQAVTRGIDPDVPMKDSGIEWLGDIPTHWEMTKLKYIVPKVTVGIVVQPAQLYVPSGIPCLRSLNISRGYINTDKLVYISPASNEANKKSKIYTGDVVVVRTGQAGVAVIVSPEFDGANCIDLLIIKKSDIILSEYLRVYINSHGARNDVEYRSVGAIQAHYNTETLANLYIPLPSPDEQHDILERIAAKIKPIDVAVNSATSQIYAVQEYRTRLIADVVIGKVDVRGIAFALPEEFETVGNTGNASYEDEVFDEMELEEMSDAD
jgi:type I restriction enzyme S subunit